ncbi:MAG: EamA family transporter [Verrucomicrobiota bacterium]|nr:EamA family transporter [Verrucomicrobiota bacterium]
MNTLSLILLSCILTALGQILFKVGMKTHALFELSIATLPTLFGQILLSPTIMGGFASFGLGAVLWLVVLARTDLSIAVPLSSLTYLFTLAAGLLLFGEVLTAQKIVGTLLVTCGIVFLSLK